MKILNRLCFVIRSKIFAHKIRRAGIPVKSNYKIIALGLGIPSTTLYLQSSVGKISRADLAVFVDSGSESLATYAHLHWLMQWKDRNDGIPIIVIEKHGLLDALVSATFGKGIRALTLPAYSRKKLKPRVRKPVVCSEQYKHDELTSFIRKIYRIDSRKKPPLTEIWFALTLGDLQRATLAPTSWQTYVYPFLNISAKPLGFEQLSYEKIYRVVECLKWLKENNFPLPPESGCIFCPLQSDSKWMQTKALQPEGWQRLVLLDKHLRRNSHSKLYLHRSCLPLEKVQFDETRQSDFTSECKGMCGL